MTNLWNNLKIWPKLLLVYVFSALVPLLLLGAYFITQVYRVSLDNSISVSLAALAQLQSNYASYLENCAVTTQRIARDPELIRYVNTHYPSAFDSIMDFQKVVTPLARPKGIVNQTIRLRVFSNNSSIYFSQEMSHSLEELREEEWYQDTTEKPDTGLNWAVSRGVAKSNYGPGILCYTPLYFSTGDNPVVHVATMFFEEAPLYKLVLAESEFGNKVFLTDGTGRIVTSTEREHLLDNFDSLGLPLPLAKMKSGTVLRMEGEDYFLQILPLRSTQPALNSWQVIRLIPADGIYQSVVEATIPGLLLCLVCLVFGVLLILLTSANIRRRIYRLNRSMHEVMDSGFEKQICPTGGDEIGDIERNFISVAAQTNRLIHEVYEAEITAAELRSQKKEAQLLALRGQINPHYLFNTLESIRMNLVVKGDRSTANIIHLFAESFRVCIEGGSGMCSLEQELHFLSQYFAIQEYRMRGKVSLKTDVPFALFNCSIPKLMLQPLVENAVYHGLELKNGMGKVRLEAREIDGILFLTVEDDGVGIDEHTLHKLRRRLSQPRVTAPSEERLALWNVNSRLQLLYGPGFGMEIESMPGRGTRVRLSLPAVHDAEGGKQCV